MIVSLSNIRLIRKHDSVGRVSNGSVLAMFATLIVFAQAFAIEPRGESWKDSYSVDGQCYCDSTFDHDVGVIVVDTPAGPRTVLQVCETIGPGPGAEGNPIYNDVQCGNGPPNDQADEVLCPGRVDMGEPGCSLIGPRWNLENFFAAPQEPKIESDSVSDSKSNSESE